MAVNEDFELKLSAVSKSWATFSKVLNEKFPDPGTRLTNGLTGEVMTAGDMLHINESHIPVWIVNERIWLNSDGEFVAPLPSFIHLPVEGCSG